MNIFFPLLTVLFVGLKLTGFIAWSWWWVLSPVWIMFLLVFTIYFIVFLVSSKD